MVTSTFVSRGRRGTRGHPASLCVAGVALTALGGFWWRTGFSADAVGAAALCVAGVALGDIDFHFAWQAWHLRHWAGSGGAPGSPLTPWAPQLFAWQAWHSVTSTFTLRGRRGTIGGIQRHFAWQAWHLRHWAGSGGAPGSQLTQWVLS